MGSTMTLDDLAKQRLDASLNEALAEIEVENADKLNAQESLTTDELSARYLSPNTLQAFSRVQLKTEVLGIDLEVKELRAHFRLRGLSLVLLLLTVSALLIGAEPLRALLQVALGT